MKNVNLCLFFFGLFLLITSCEQKEEPQIDLEAEKRAIQKVDEEFHTAISSHDLEKLKTLLAENVVSLTHNPDYPKADGIEVVSRLTQEFFDETPDLKVRTESQMIHISPDANMAYLIGNYSMTYGKPEDPQRDSGRYIFVLNKNDGFWKIAAHAGRAGIWDDEMETDHFYHTEVVKK